MKFIITIDLIKIFCIYLFGCILDFFIWLFIKIKYYLECRKKYKTLKNGHKIFINKDLVTIFLSWLFICFIFIEFLEYLDKKYKKNFKYLRIKYLLRGWNKEKVLEQYFYNKYYYEIKEISNKKIVYRIKNDELCGWKYSSENLKSYTEDLTDENIKEYFDWEEIGYFKECYKDVIIERFIKKYK